MKQILYGLALAGLITNSAQAVRGPFRLVQMRS